ncbi:putative pentatricopeptide repeat-containing protein At5g52630 [Curcuma longa]|uniref:putative pentatricopeptide repeat-containing protein At5g52630 n=1 Tax=Curcuma longa TaxID=136217 RepID=UPI003D9F81A0
MTTFSLNSTLRAHLNTGRPREALAYFLESQKEGLRPDRFTIPALIKLSLQLKVSPLHGQQIHGFAIRSSCMGDLVVGTGLVEMYLKYGCFDEAYRLFDEIPERDVISFSTMICGFSQNGRATEALHFFSRMLEEGIEPNRITIASLLSSCARLKEVKSGRMLHGYCFRSGLLDTADVVLRTALVDLYSKCRKMDCAKSVFDRMTERNLVSWNSIINGYFFDGSFEAALQLFKEMVSHNLYQLRSSILATVLNVCGLTTDLRKGKEMHGYILKHVYDNNNLDFLVVYNSILNMYVKSGSIEYATSLFGKMPRKNVVTWTILITCYGQYGMSAKALQLLDEMKRLGVRPDGVTFVSVLSACSHGGLVDEGKEIYNSMERDYCIVPEMMHFICMVDLYGRSGLLEEAHEFINMMPVEPDKAIWLTLLSSCRNHRNLELGEHAARKTLELDQYDTNVYVHLSRLYADAGRWEILAKTRSVMKELGLKPETACSWVEAKGIVHRFSVGDCSLKDVSPQIYDLLESVRKAMNKSGFVSDTSCVSHKMKEDDKVMDLCGHTEKLALAFALMKGGSIIRIATYNKEIILKDPNRYHRFSQGRGLWWRQHIRMEFKIEVRQPWQLSEISVFITEALKANMSGRRKGASSTNADITCSIPSQSHKNLIFEQKNERKEVNLRHLVGFHGAGRLVVGHDEASKIDLAEEANVGVAPPGAGTGMVNFGDRHLDAALPVGAGEVALAHVQTIGGVGARAGSVIRSVGGQGG